MMPNTFGVSKSLISKLFIVKNITMNPVRFQSHSKLIKQRAYVDGEWVCAGNEKVFSVMNPANGALLSKVPDMDEMDVELAVRAAKIAFKDWKNTTAYERSQILKKWYQLMVKNGDNIAEIITLECGKPIKESIGEVNYGNSYIEYYAEEARRMNGEIIPSTDRSKKYFVEKSPIGVVGLITAFNFPLAMITRKLSAALAAGCTCVVKPATDTPLTALAMAEIAQEAGIPKGVINIVTSSHASNPLIVDYLCRNPDIRGISFTGSVQVGKIIYEKCASTVKRIGLELGGNAPFIVYNSANVENAVQAAINSKFRNAGQTCIAPNRFLVQDGIFDCFIENLVVEMRRLKMGDGTQSDVKIGPLINKPQLDKIRHLVDDAVCKGAKIMLGGKKAVEVGELFYEPTVLTDVRENMELFSGEIFGPVVSVLKFRTEEESLYIANQTEVGLAGYIFSGDISQVFRVSKHLDVGMIGINEGLISASEIPFGGVKESGIGREGGKRGIDEYIDVKYVCLGNLRL